MPNADGTNSAADDSGTKVGEGVDDGAATTSGKGKQNKSGDDAKDDDDEGGKAGKIVFNSQKELDDVIQRRVARATKKLEDDAKLTDQQRLEKERDDARAEVRERDVRDEFVAKADVSPAIAMRIFKAYRDDLDINDAGKATNIDEVLKAAKKDMPQLFTKQPALKPGGGDGSNGSGGDGKTGGDMNAALRRMAGKG